MAMLLGKSAERDSPAGVPAACKEKAQALWQQAGDQQAPAEVRVVPAQCSTVLKWQAGLQRKLACTHSSLSFLSQVAMGSADMVPC